MTLVLDKFKNILPHSAKPSPSGWLSFNAPCCQHRGHKADTRKRAGVKFDTGVIYNCFNCKFTASWQPGRQISDKLRQLCLWLGASDSDIKELVFEALKTESPDYAPVEYKSKIEFEEKQLPKNCFSISTWVDRDLDTKTELLLADVIEYVISRGVNPLDKNFYWADTDGYRDRVVLPFFYKGKIVGYTARKVKPGKPKYLSDQHPHFVYNVDKQLDQQRYVFVCEGPFDALSIGGVALLTNNIADQQANIINRLGKEVIVIPDQDIAGLNLIDKACEYDWSVAFPQWDDDVKDVAEAVQRYGELFVLVDAIKTAQQGRIKIEVYKNKLKKTIENNL
mgnify:CR=1 FL=1